jgi:hypothetical protein
MPISTERRLASPDETSALGAEIALWLRSGDFIALTGPVGAGKTVLARAIIGALGSAPVEVTSPTFTMAHHYPDLRLPTVHFDLYRVSGASECDELGLEDALDRGVALVEWADRLGDGLPRDRLDIALDDVSAHARHAVLTGHGDWEARLGRCLDLADFIEAAGWSGAARQWLKGDASTRAYERLTDTGGSRSAVLMNAPRGPDGPPVRDGVAYSRIAHLAEDARAFVAVDRYLLARGLSAPRIHAYDLVRGFLLLEDLGDRLYGGLVRSRCDLTQPYEAAIAALCRIQDSPPPSELAAGDTAVHRFARYDLEAMLIEVELLTDWAWPAWHGGSCPEDMRASYRCLWSDLLSGLSGPDVLTLRDFHSPNLLWLPEREGAARAGIIDFQDAVIGHPAYDLASLAQDARVDLPDGMEGWIIDTWLGGRPDHVRGLPADEFLADYALLAAQRAAKIVGIFCRLALRDRKPGYLAHLPRVCGYLRASLAHPRLAPLTRWFGRHFDLDREWPPLAGAA